MTTPYRGGCGCGALRYEIAAEPFQTNDCHCRQCQRDSGTGHGSYMPFPLAAAVLQGETRSHDFIGDLGTVKRRVFCPTCGTPVYILFPQMPDLIVVKAGTLDEPERYRPQVVFWAEAAQSWDPPSPALKILARMPSAAS
jgi:hypothetical protein